MTEPNEISINQIFKHNIPPILKIEFGGQLFLFEKPAKL